MRRGTTCRHTFRTNVDLTNATIFVTYQQGKSTILEKTGNDLTVQARKVIVNLTQEDTLSFTPNTNVVVQLRYIMEDGTADASNTIAISVQDVLKEGEIAYVAPNNNTDTTDTTDTTEGA
jgi:hypothetical protein